MTDQQLLRYARHINLLQIGIEGQEKISASSVLVVGAGGLGCIVSLLFVSAGVRTLVIADGDDVELSNLQRQILHGTRSLGKPKVDSAALRLRETNPEVEIVPLHAKVGTTDASLHEHLAGVSLVVDCTDNFRSRRYINRCCAKARIPLLAASVDQLEGYAAGFDFRESSSPCYECLFPGTEDHPPADCALYGVFSPVVQIIGSLAVSKGLSLLAGSGFAAFDALDWFNLETPSLERYGTSRSASCAACA